MNPKPAILVIDDELSIRKSIQAVFEDDCRVYPARDGEEGLKVLRKKKPDLIILDIKLPGIDGIEVLGKIKEVDPAVPIILLTGYGSLSSAQKAIRLGASDYLKKPFDVGKLREVVNSALSKRAEERKKEEEAIRESEKKLKAQYQHIPIPTYTWQKVGDDFILADYNEATVAITSGKVEGYRGMKVSEIHPDDPQIPEAISRCYASRKPILQEMEYTLKSTGQTKFLSVKYVFVPPDLVMAHTEDITERKQTEEVIRKAEDQHRQVIENILEFVPEGLLVFTDKLNLFKTNKTFREIVKKYSVKLNYQEDELSKIIIEQVKKGVTEGDYAEIRVSKRKNEKTKNK